jgi:hypothetical protein
MLVGLDSGQTEFDVVEETGGAKTKAISAHAGTAVGTSGAGSAHTHTQGAVTQPNAHTDVLNHVHNQTRLPTATGGVTGFTVDTSMSGTPTTSGVDTGNPTANGVASQAHTGTAVANPANESAHTHAAGSVTQPSAHTDLNVLPPYVVVYMWKRTA